jgi:excisionase family DNA binding protein
MEIIDARELSRYLKINEKKIYKLVQESVIPHIKIGGKIAFTRELIDEWILENTVQQKHVFTLCAAAALVFTAIGGIGPATADVLPPLDQMNGLFQKFFV